MKKTATEPQVLSKDGITVQYYAHPPVFLTVAQGEHEAWRHGLGVAPAGLWLSEQEGYFLNHHHVTRLQATQRPNSELLGLSCQKITEEEHTPEPPVS